MVRILAVLLCVCCCFRVSSESVKVGFSVRDITPGVDDIKKGIKTHGWGVIIKDLQKGDRLFVRAIAMRDKKNTLLVILTADTGKFHASDVYVLQEWFEKTFKVNRWHLIMNASHTHQAPSTYFPYKYPYVKKYHKIFMDSIKTTIAEAVKNATKPVIVKFANLKLCDDMIYNKVYDLYSSQAKRPYIIRQNKSKTYSALAKKFNFVDTDFPVFAFFDIKTRKIAGFLWSVAAHPSYIGSGGLCGRSGMKISSHAPGAVARQVHKTYGKNVVSMFAQGAGGDIKMKFPSLDNKLVSRYSSKAKCRESVWRDGPNKGKKLTQEQYFKALNSYGMLYIDIIKRGFANHKFKEIKNIDLKIAGKEIKIPLALKRPARKSKLGQLNRCYWTRPKGSVESYRKIIADEKSTAIKKYQAYEALSMIYDNKRAAYTLYVTRVIFNKRLQLVAMSNEVCCKIGMEVKRYYKQRGIETVFWGYSPFGTPYYPSNQHKTEGTYQGSWMHPAPGFDFNKFALDNITKLNPR